MAKGKGFTDIWGITAPRKGPDDSQAARFRKAFSKRIRELGARIESAMRFALAADVKDLIKSRDGYFKDYNNVAREIDKDDPEKAQDYIDALLQLMDTAIFDAQLVDAKGIEDYLKWSEAVGDFEELSETIEELDSEGYGDVGRLLQVKEIIEQRVHEHRWLKAKEAVEKLDPAVQKAEAAHAAAGGGDDTDDDDIILLEDDRTERKYQRKYNKLLKKIDKKAKRIVAKLDLAENLADLRSGIEAEREVAQDFATAGAYKQAYETLTGVADQCDEFADPYKDWTKAKARCNALLPKVTEAVANIELIDAFNRELQTEIEHFEELSDLDSTVTPLTDAFDFIKAEVLLADLLQRSQHLQRRDLQLEDQRQATELQEELDASLQAVLQQAPLAVLAKQQQTVVARRDAVETQMLGEKYAKAVKLLIKMEDAIITFELDKQAFDDKVAALEARFAAADPAAKDAEGGKIIGELSKPELASLPEAFRASLLQAVEEGEDGADKEAAAGALADSEPEPIVEEDDFFDGRLDAAKKQFADFKKIPRKKRELIKRQMDEAAQALKGIEASVADADFPAAEKLLERIDEIYDEARAALELFSGYPDPEKLQEVLDNNGGAEVFDKLVAGLPKGVPQNAFEKAIELRFGVELELEDTEGDPEQMYDKKDRGLQEVFKMLEKVPEHHVIDNDMLSKIVRRSDLDEGAYWTGPEDGKGKGHIVLNCGRPQRNDFEEDFVDPRAEGLDPDCQRRPGAKKPPYFSFTTLHEIGHAVDEKSQVMNSKMAKPSFGGWIDHKEDCSTIADIAAAHFGFDSKQIEAWLRDDELDEDDAPQAPEDKTEAAKWRKTRDKTLDWCLAVKMTGEDDGLFNRGSKARKYAIGGRVYQEAYSGKWVSYDVGARRQAITGYQFRAPGEWFAEIYAAYYSDQLKDSHPAVSWLTQLETPEGTVALAAA